ncbi:MAG: hypothetical protein ACRAVC_20755 [Trichormus sp.]
MLSTKAAGNSIALWAERDSRPTPWGRQPRGRLSRLERTAVIEHWYVLSLTPCPIPYAQKLHPQGDGVFHYSGRIASREQIY